MAHTRSVTYTPRMRAAAWLALLGLLALVTLPALHFAPRSAPALAAAERAHAPETLSAPEAIRSHLSCPVCLALARARGVAIDTASATLVLAPAALPLGPGAAQAPPAAPDLEDQQPRAPPHPA